ncbi:tetratricopeptide repeat protein [Cyanobacterium aponinum UTEX 3222]|uniref:Tetratricopeptide repeat protein n=2 Tax=Cyanobacterium aponinum TaxID=379064 RepID=A0A844GVG7_9CHRO|nr:tetratricopeptide repeat protein [Cyanobacterium aponinum]MTF39573.1 tetratricopeptide repeat protein [Cyanobacterium aponinum 0216]WPF89055.1 tetratricopeptide repeat protein [Cyanobacterium aponinum AL20115]WRL37402.1 tetratricopeptide repeat protein [Cyanobacterium aponinum UTEX 3221]WRL43763.1 tetratricopeptide repeat protein [Cyanobacterium aponinum UTEX 3222]
MKPISESEFNNLYQTGKLAFEKGCYRLSIENLEKACQLASFYTRVGGEARIWLVNAYEAGRETEKAIALCEELTAHPHLETKKQALRLLYILKAPQLKRPEEWMTKIPDLNADTNNLIKYNPPSNGKKIKPPPQIVLEDFSKINTKDNRFIWLSLIVSGLTLTGLLFL